MLPRVFNPSGTHPIGTSPAFGQLYEEANGRFTAIIEANIRTIKHLSLLLFYTSASLFSRKALTISTIQNTVRRSFSAPRGSRKVASFRLWAPFGHCAGTKKAIFVPRGRLEHASGNIFMGFRSQRETRNDIGVLEMRRNAAIFDFSVIPAFGQKSFRRYCPAVTCFLFSMYKDTSF